MKKGEPLRKVLPRKLLIIHTGGTIGMGLVRAGADVPLSPDHSFVRTLRKTVPELWRLADIDIRAYCHKDSSEITPDDWVKLYGLIGKHYDHYDAFVVTHGTDTMVYTGTALSYLMPFPCKPVVLTGSQRPLREIRTDARRNLINSVAIAASQKVCEVSIFFDTLLLRANRSKKVHIEEYQAFDSPNFNRLAQERLKTMFNAVARERLNRPTLTARFDSRIQIVRAFPGAEVVASPKARAVVVESFGCGNLPAAHLRLLRTCQKRRIPVILASQVESGRLAPEIYEMGRKALKLGAIPSLDMTLEAALVKAMLLAGNEIEYDLWPAAIPANWAGELTS